MAYGSQASFALYFPDPQPVPAGRIVDALQAVDYSYNLLAIIELLEQGYHPPAESALELILGAQDYGVAITNHALRTMVDEPARLELVEVKVGGSFEFALRGMNRVVWGLAELVGASARAAGDSAGAALYSEELASRREHLGRRERLRQYLAHKDNARFLLETQLSDERVRRFYDGLETAFARETGALERAEFELFDLPY